MSTKAVAPSGGKRRRSRLSLADQFRSLSIAHQPLQLLRELRQPPPVEGHSMAGSRWRQSHPLVESERVLDIAVEPKAVRFKIGAIWTGRQQVDGDRVRLD